MIKPPLLVAGFLVTLSAPAFAEDTCHVKAVLGGKPAEMKSCAASVYEPSDGKYSVTLWFSDAPFGAKDLQDFHESSNTPDKTADGKPRTAIHFSFCSGVGKGAASAAAVTSVETGVDVAGAPLSGGKVSDGLKYSWEADFGFTLPAKGAFGGTSCGG